MRKNQARWWEQIPLARYSGRVVSMGERGPRLGLLYLEPLSRMLEWAALADRDPRLFIITRAGIVVDVAPGIEYVCNVDH